MLLLSQKSLWSLPHVTSWLFVLCAAWHSKYSAVFPPVGKVTSSQLAFNNLLSKSPEAHLLLTAHCSSHSPHLLGTPMASTQVSRRSHQITSSQPQQRQTPQRLLTIFFSLFSSRFLSSWACFSSASFFWRSSSWAFNWAWMKWENRKPWGGSQVPTRGQACPGLYVLWQEGNTQHAL